MTRHAISVGTAAGGDYYAYTSIFVASVAHISCLAVVYIVFVLRFFGSSRAHNYILHPSRSAYICMCVECFCRVQVETIGKARLRTASSACQRVS